MKRVLLACAVVSAILATLMLYVGAQHNAMGEFCVNPDSTACEPDFAYAFGIWLSWFVVSGVFTSALGSALFWLLRSRHGKE
jgi:hypothetical protein